MKYSRAEKFADYVRNAVVRLLDIATAPVGIVTAYYPKENRSRYNPHQGTKECERRFNRGS